MQRTKAGYKMFPRVSTIFVTLLRISPSAGFFPRGNPFNAGLATEADDAAGLCHRPNSQSGTDIAARKRRSLEATDDDTCYNDAMVIDALLEANDSKYDKSELPDGDGTDVSVEMWVQDISRIIEWTSQFELDLYVTEQWTDQRLSFSQLNPCKMNMSVDGSTLGEILSILPKIWTPRACFVNSKNASIHRSPVTNIFLMFYANGTVWVNYRIKLIGPCKKNLKTFPIDDQTCQLVYESFPYNHESVHMHWTDVQHPVSFPMDRINLPDYTLEGVKASIINRVGLMTYASGVWNTLVASFHFKRRYGFYILQAYVPAYLSVFISWVSFYLGAVNLASRTTVGVNSLLSLTLEAINYSISVNTTLCHYIIVFTTFQFGTIVQNLPRSSDVKAIDVWLLSCMSFIFATLIELALVGWITRYNINNGITCTCTMFCVQCPFWTANKIDGISMIAFPTCFMLFNIYYWLVFLNEVNCDEVFKT